MDGTQLLRFSSRRSESNCLQEIPGSRSLQQESLENCDNSMHGAKAIHTYETLPQVSDGILPRVRSQRPLPINGCHSASKTQAT